MRLRRSENNHYVKLCAALEGWSEGLLSHATLARLVPAPESTIRRLATRLVANGVLRRVGRGHYLHRDATEQPPLNEMINAVSEGGTAHYCYATAMAAHGQVIPALAHRIFLRTSGRYRTLELPGDLELVRTTAGFARKLKNVTVRHPLLGTIQATPPLETALDGLDRPGWCGEVEEVARFVAAWHSTWSDEALRGAWTEHPTGPVRRLGFLIEQTGRRLPDALAPLEPGSQRFHLLAVNRDREGPSDVRWRIRVNVPLEPTPQK